MADSHRIPTLPALHAHAMAVIHDPDVEFLDLATLVEADPAMTAAVFRAANSAFSAPVSPVTRATDALVRIGLGTTRRIIVGAVLGESFRGLEGAGLDTDALWHHVLACGVIADALSGGAGGTAFTAGLLHDLGRMAMAHADPVRYARVVRMTRSGVDAREAEVDLFGRDHVAWGLETAEQWAIPAPIQAAIGGHHRPASRPEAQPVRLARRIAARMAIGDGLLPGADLQRLADEEPLDDVAEARLASAGGERRITERIDWFRQGLAGSFAPSLAA